MLQIKKIRKSIQDLAQMALDHRKLDERSKTRVSKALEALNTSSRPKVLLFGVSQAGKSTLLSTLMRGEQFVPIGIGTATTVVPTELWPVDSPGDERAVILWKSPREVLASMINVLRNYLKISLHADNEAAPPSKKSAHPSDEVAMDVLDLSDLRVRAHLKKALEEAEDEFRRLLDEGEPTSNGEAIMIARALLSYYETYEQGYSEAGTEIPLSEAHTWLRRPPDWMKRHEFDQQHTFPYSFDEIKCFYLKRAQIYARCLEGLSRVCLVDAPGYGIAAFDNAVLDEEAQQADSIILVLGSQGSQITQSQLEQVGRLSINLSRNPFVLWNAKALAQQQAETILSGDISTIRRVVGLGISRNRALVANFLIALRAIQLLRFKELSELSLESIREEAVGKGFPAQAPETETKRNFVRRYLTESLRNSYEAFTYKKYYGAGKDRNEQALSASNLNSNLNSIIGLISQTHEAILLRDCAKEVISVLQRFILTRPTQAKYDDLKKQFEQLTKAIPQFQKGAQQQQKKLEGVLKTSTEELKSELLEMLWEYSHYKNVKSSIKSEIDRTYSRTYVPAILRRNLSQLVMARLQLWLQQVEKKESNRLRNHLLSEYQIAWLSLRDDLRRVCEDNEGLLTLPDWTSPKFDLSEFQSGLKSVIEAALEEQFEDYIFKGIVRSAESFKVEAIKTGRNWLNKGKSFVKKLGIKVEVKKYPPPARFDRSAAKAEVSDHVDGFYQLWKSKIPDDMTWEHARQAFEIGIKKAIDKNSGTYSDLLTRRMNELDGMLKNSPAPLATDERQFFLRVIEGLSESLALVEQLERHDNSPLLVS